MDSIMHLPPMYIILLPRSINWQSLQSTELIAIWCFNLWLYEFFKSFTSSSIYMVPDDLLYRDAIKPLIYVTMIDLISNKFTAFVIVFKF